MTYFDPKLEILSSKNSVRYTLDQMGLYFIIELMMKLYLGGRKVVKILLLSYSRTSILQEPVYTKNTSSRNLLWNEVDNIHS